MITFIYDYLLFKHTASKEYWEDAHLRPEAFLNILKKGQNSRIRNWIKLCSYDNKEFIYIPFTRDIYKDEDQRKSYKSFLLSKEFNKGFSPKEQQSMINHALQVALYCKNFEMIDFLANFHVKPQIMTLETKQFAFFLECYDEKYKALLDIKDKSVIEVQDFFVNKMIDLLNNVVRNIKRDSLQEEIGILKKFPTQLSVTVDGQDTIVYNNKKETFLKIMNMFLFFKKNHPSLLDHLIFDRKMGVNFDKKDMPIDHYYPDDFIIEVNVMIDRKNLHNKLPEIIDNKKKLTKKI